MNKTEFVDHLSSVNGVTKKVGGEAVEMVFDSLSHLLACGNAIQFMGFGTFEVKANPARDGRNPMTGEKIKVKASRSPKFKPGAALKAAVNGG